MVLDVQEVPARGLRGSKGWCKEENKTRLVGRKERTEFERSCEVGVPETWTIKEKGSIMY